MSESWWWWMKRREVKAVVGGQCGKMCSAIKKATEWEPELFMSTHWYLDLIRRHNTLYVTKYILRKDRWVSLQRVLHIQQKFLEHNFLFNLHRRHETQMVLKCWVQLLGYLECELEVPVGKVCWSFDGRGLQKGNASLSNLGPEWLCSG